jgi:hypothetical protein
MRYLTALYIFSSLAYPLKAHKVKLFKEKMTPGPGDMLKFLYKEFLAK